jgi:integrase
LGKHRGHREGSIYRRESDGRWVASLSLEDGGRKYIYGKTRKEAYDKLQKALLEQQQGKLPTGPKQTVKQYLEYWLEEVHKPTIRLSSYVKYRRLIRIHILPALGHVQLQKLSPQQVQSFYKQKSEEGLSPKMVHSIHGVLHKALGNAVRWKLVSSNVCDLLSPPRLVKQEIQPLTPDQARSLIEAARGHRLEGVLVLAITTGMRRGELLALRWQDIDFENKNVQIRRTVDFFAGYGGYIETEPKTAKGRRMIALPPFVIGVLRQRRLAQLELRLKAGAAWEEHDLVFTGLHGNYLNPRYILKLFAQVLQDANLPHLRFHDLRHSAATLLLGMGVHPKVVQEILGHSQIGMTMDTYSHVLPSMQKEAMDKWGDILGDGTDEDTEVN